MPLASAEDKRAAASVVEFRLSFILSSLGLRFQLKRERRTFGFDAPQMIHGVGARQLNAAASRISGPVTKMPGPVNSEAIARAPPPAAVAMHRIGPAAAGAEDAARTAVKIAAFRMNFDFVIFVSFRHCPVTFDGLHDGKFGTARCEFPLQFCSKCDLV